MNSGVQSTDENLTANVHWVNTATKKEPITLTQKVNIKMYVLSSVIIVTG